MNRVFFGQIIILVNSTKKMYSTMCCFWCNDDHREFVLCGYAHFAMLLLLVSFLKLFNFILLQRDANVDINSTSTKNYVLPQVVIVGDL